MTTTVSKLNSATGRIVVLSPVVMAAGGQCM